MRHGIARTEHVVPDRPPLTVHVGQTVQVGRRDTEWPAFVFVTADTGTGWVPSRHLSGESGAATVLTTYDTTELPLKAGQRIEIVDSDDESGWYWCRDAAGRLGWVPTRTIDVVDDSDGG